MRRTATSAGAKRGVVVSTALLLALMTLCTTQAAAQSQRTVLWLVAMADDATIDAPVVIELFTELLSGATDAEHIVDVQGLAEYITLNGYPLPRCFLGLDECEDVGAEVAELLRLDLIAVVEVHGAGERLVLQVREPSSGLPRFLEYTGPTIVESAYQLVGEFVGTVGRIEVSSTPPGATVMIDGEVFGETPLEETIAAGIHIIRIELDGYSFYENTFELQPDRVRIIERELERLPAELQVITVTPGAQVYLDGELAGDASEPIWATPGEHTVRIVAEGYESLERRVRLVSGEGVSLQVDLEEEGDAGTSREMDYIYERPFYGRAAFRFSGARSGLAGAEGAVGGRDLTVLCPRDIEGDFCASEGVPVNLTGLDVGVGYSFEIFEINLISFGVGFASLGGSAGDGHVLTLEAADGQDETGTVTDLTRLDLRFLGVGARYLATADWSFFGHGQLGWYTEMFDIDSAGGVSGAFSRSGWGWLVDGGARFHINDTVFLEAAVALGGDLTHDSDVGFGFGVGVGMTWEDFLGIQPEGDR